jgi:hypothetical protein
MTDNPQRCCHHDVCYMVHTQNKCINDTPCDIPCIFDSRKAINFSRCPSVTLPSELAAFYTQRSAETGKSVSELVTRDLEEYHASQRYYANRSEKTHP